MFNLIEYFKYQKHVCTPNLFTAMLWPTQPLPDGDLVGQIDAINTFELTDFIVWTISLLFSFSIYHICFTFLPTFAKLN